MDAFQPVFAFFLGLTSFVTACVLPVIPGYLVYLFGNSRIGKVGGAFSIFTGIAIGGMLIGALLSALSPVGSTRCFYLAAAVLLMVLTIETVWPNFIRPITFSWLHGKKGVLAGFVFGLLIIFVASPCILPLLTVTAIFALTVDGILLKVGLLLAYAAGLGLPFIIIAAFSGSSRKLNEFAKTGVMRRVELIVLVFTVAWLLWGFISY